MSKKIMFNDKYGLTDAVLKGVKTMTRRMMNHKCSSLLNGTEAVSKQYIMEHSPFQKGEIVAIAQSYSDVLEEMISKKGGFGKEESDFQDEWYGTPGYNNKMFVRADLMPYHIRITNVKIERLQEINDSDCLREGVLQRKISHFGVIETMFQVPYTPIYKNTPREAFSALIDKVGKKGDWDKNPWVYVYEFELVD